MKPSKSADEEEAFRALPELCEKASSSIGFIISLAKRYKEKAVDGEEAASIKKKVLKYFPAALCRTADGYADLIWFSAQVGLI